MPFLSIVTRVYQRPTFFLTCVTSVFRQSDPDYEHILLVDEQGQGVAWANGQFYRHRHRVRGEYVYLLDDDDMLIRDDVVSLFKQAATSRPDVVMCRFEVDGHGVLPDSVSWQQEPVFAHVCTSCMAVRRDIWLRFIRHFDAPAGGDYQFLAAMWPHLRHIEWLDVVVGRTQRVSRGAAG